MIRSALRRPCCRRRGDAPLLMRARSRFRGPSQAARPALAILRGCGRRRSTSGGCSCGLARHSAMVDGSFPRASNRSFRVSGSRVRSAIRFSSACTCCGEIERCHISASAASFVRSSFTFARTISGGIRFSNGAFGSVFSFGQIRFASKTRSIASFARRHSSSGSCWPAEREAATQTAIPAKRVTMPRAWCALQACRGRRPSGRAVLESVSVCRMSRSDVRWHDTRVDFGSGNGSERGRPVVGSGPEPGLW
jgi:hypothetical protein